MKKKKINFKIKVDQTKLRNEMHFEVQRTTRSNIYRDKTKYTRKKKHKNREEF